MEEGRCSRCTARPRAGLMLLQLLSCLPGCCRGVDWRGLGCMYEINYFESRTTRSRCCATHRFLFLFARHVVQVQLEEGGVLVPDSIAFTKLQCKRWFGFWVSHSGRHSALARLEDRRRPPRILLVLGEQHVDKAGPLLVLRRLRDLAAPTRPFQDNNQCGQ